MSTCPVNTRNDYLIAKYIESTKIRNAFNNDDIDILKSVFIDAIDANILIFDGDAVSGQLTVRLLHFMLTHSSDDLEIMFVPAMCYPTRDLDFVDNVYGVKIIRVHQLDEGCDLHTDLISGCSLPSGKTELVLGVGYNKQMLGAI